VWGTSLATEVVLLKKLGENEVLGSSLMSIQCVFIP
jgi:hypothetical protein